MILTQLIYYSDASEQITADVVSHFVEAAHRRNLELGLTGFLIYNRRHFLQLIEGGRTNLNHVYGRIMRDERHGSPILLGYRPIHERTFPQWGMRYAPLSTERSQRYLRFSPTPDFAPHHMCYDSAKALLVDMAMDA